MGHTASRQQHHYGDEEVPSISRIAAKPLLHTQEVAKLGLVRHAVYATLSAHVYEALLPPDPPIAPTPLPEGWQVLANCSHFQLDREGYFAVAYVHHTLRHCIIAQRGTSEVLALRAGVWMYFDEPTIQFYLAEQFSAEVRKYLQSNLSSRTDAMNGGWQISYTGHSLGAVLATCRALEENTFAIVFESPGNRDFYAKLAPHSQRKLDAHTINYLREPNPINTLKPQCGYQVMMPSQPVQMPHSLLLPQSTATSAALRPEQEAHGSGGAAVTTPNTPILSVDGTAVVANTEVVMGATPSSTSSPAPPAAPDAVAATVPATTRFLTMTRGMKMPSISRPQLSIRRYVLQGAGLGIPELQQYVSKIEPMIRDMVERTQQMHAIRSMVEHFAKQDEPDGEQVVIRWPAHLMQFMEYYNTKRALEDPENHAAQVKAAYEGLLQRLCLTEPRQRDRMPIAYIPDEPLKMVVVWAKLDSSARAAIPLRLLDHKALNSIRVEDGWMISSIMSVFEAKQYLMSLARRPSVQMAMERLRDAAATSRSSKL